MLVSNGIQLSHSGRPPPYQGPKIRHSANQRCGQVMDRLTSTLGSLLKACRPLYLWESVLESANPFRKGTCFLEVFFGEVT